jgi:hypothetical protein
MATTKKRTTNAKPASRAKSRSASNGGIPPIRGKARREAIEAFLEMTSKDLGLSPELKARLKDDAWGKRLVDP